MAGEQRKCANCRYFRDAGMAGNGWCTHPKRQYSSDVKILVRAGELACRNSWGGDMFQSRNDSGPSSEPDVAHDLPGGHQESDASRDDEVTSVITPPDRSDARSGKVEEDRVVSDRPAPLREPDVDPHNNAAREDQEERARVLARGSRDALMRARERHSNRRNRSSTDPGSDDDNDDPGTWADSGDRVATRQKRFSDRFRSARDITQTPDQDAPVPRAEIERHWLESSGRFETVPEVDPAFDLPGWRGQDQRESKPVSPEKPLQAEDTHSPVQVEPAPISTYEHMLQRARRVREGKSHKADHPTRRARKQLRQAQHRASQPNTLEPAVADDIRDEFDPDDRGVLPAAQPEPALAQGTPAQSALDEHHVATDDTGLADEPRYADGDDLDYIDEDEFHDDVDFYQDELQDESEPFAYDDGPGAHDPERPGWRLGGLLSTLGLGRRRAPAAHDDAMVTRHAEAYEDEASWDDEWNEPDTHALSAPGWDDRDDADALLDTDDESYEYDPLPANLGNESYIGHNQISEHLDAHESDYDVAYDNTYAADEQHLFLDDERERGERAAYDPVLATHGRPEAWHRQRLVQELPDLDDNLFEETFNRRVPSPTATLDRAPMSEEPSLHRETEASRISTSPSESYFRAARFREWAEAHTDESALEARDRGESVDRATLPDIEEPNLDLRELVARGSELLDMTIEIAPDVPRECRTCRSFRSADGGSRGWCTNAWAFTHRRMVNEEDLACETAIGCWWLPADRYWLIEEQDGYAAATPRMDELVARHSGARERRASGTGA